MSEPKISGLNHLTLAVGELERSIGFYCDLLGFTLRARWADGAYLEAGALWLCLSCDKDARTSPHPDYSHVAFDVAPEAFDALSERVRRVARIWKENRSEGPSLYFLDPDGHRLELHVGSLASRLAHFRANPAPGLHVIDA
ncbi:glutathione transferase [Sphingomonas oleivorans]|uniref:Glutathione transferase n=1 Tax=Sphingomonas oleivorans TaxID=1735121 RepID=A0A2T5G1R5_9SPHN|nr:fosfomycin resistance glutathione transferase [Sphingomonas oleivorans]PTQ13107.1 glutathione transferase [Sphingomonas oleivorans]